MDVSQPARFPSFSEWQRRLRSSLGVEVLAGFDAAVGGERFGATPVRPWGRCWVGEAVLTRLDDRNGFSVRTAALPEQLPDAGVVVVFRMSFGNGAPIAQQTGSFGLEVNGEPILSFTGVRDRQRWRGSGGDLLFIPEIARASRPGEVLVLDTQLTQETWAIEGAGILWLRRERVAAGHPITIRVSSESRVASRNWVRFASPITDQGAFFHEAEIATLVYGPSERRRRDAHLLLFGDIHNHTGQTESGFPCGRGTRAAAFGYAREIAGLDFCCLSEHDFQLGEGEWEQLQELNDAWDKPGEFVTLHGYEWTSGSYGHRNVYFRERGGPFLRTSPRRPGPDGWVENPLERGDHQFHPEVLWRALDEWGGAAITIPHHPTAAIWPLSLDQAFNERYDHLVEIYSGWGDSLHVSSPLNLNVQYIPELEISRFVHRFPIGFVASSDSHDGHPGNAQGHDQHAHFFHPAGSGHVAVYAEEFARDAIFDALYSRRCYAVTGGRIGLDVRLNDNPMGAMIPGSALTERPVVEVIVQSSLRCETAEIFDGGLLVHSQSLTTADTRFEWTDTGWTPGDPRTYYVRLTREDGEQAWSSPIRVTGGESSRDE